MVRRLPFLLGGIALFLVNALTLSIGFGFGLSGVPAALLIAAPVVLCWYRPMAAWWLALAGLLLLTLLGPVLSDDEALQYRPWLLNAIPAHLAVVYVLALSVRLRIAIPAFVIYLAAGALTPIHLLDDLPNAIAGAIVWAMAVLVAMVLGHNKRVRLTSTLRIAEERGRRLVLEERNRIARELHDMVAHHMSVIAVQTATARYRLPGGVSEEASREFQAINATARESLREMRHLLGVLRDPADPAETEPPPQGLADLPRLMESARRAGTPVRLAVVDTPDPLSPAAALTAYRIVQEALSNVVRHATGAATRVEVAPDETCSALIVEVHNAPPDAPPPAVERPHPGHGLVGMRERVAVHGGDMTAAPTPEGGFIVRATLPLASSTGAGEPSPDVMDGGDGRDTSDDQRIDRR
ncbi:sensor histidine kinase [Nocardiopsis sediminis]|uniref:histidine kinase n=1 Tax=Nocardiopsis sediminis TaxID=1778267 RepID=A0ABV8FN49_9ACTN